LPDKSIYAPSPVSAAAALYKPFHVREFGQVESPP
jgi:hypothetical protein